jgi:hypothetical protein
MSDAWCKDKLIQNCSGRGGTPINKAQRELVSGWKEILKELMLAQYLPHVVKVRFSLQNFDLLCRELVKRHWTNTELVIMSDWV